MTKEMVRRITSVSTMLEESASTFIPSLRADLNAEERKTEIREIAKDAIQVDDRLNLVLGEILHEVSETGYWKDWINPETDKFFTTFEEYCETELDLRKSKAYYLKAIYHLFVVELALPLKVLRSLYWSSAKELRHVITKENALDLLDKISDMSVTEVKAMVKAMLAPPPLIEGEESEATGKDLDEEPSVRVSFKFTSSQAENVRNALKVASEMSESSVSSHNLDLICTDFLAGAQGQTAADRLSVLIASIERTFGVKLEVVSDDDEFSNLQDDNGASVDDGTEPSDNDLDNTKEPETE